MIIVQSLINASRPAELLTTPLTFEFGMGYVNFRPSQSWQEKTEPKPISLAGCGALVDLRRHPEEMQTLLLKHRQ